jgi:hypothetical protein
MKMERIVTSLAVDGLGWIAINEVAQISNLPYCLGVKDYKARKTLFRSYAEGTFVFEVPEYFADRFGKIWNAPCEGVFSLYDSLPKTIPSELETRLLDLLDDEKYVKEMKKNWLETQKLGIVEYTNKSTMFTRYGEFPVSLLEEHIFNKITWFERFMFWFCK